MDTDVGSVVARRGEPGAVRLFDPPGSPRRATAGKMAEKREKRAEKPKMAGWGAENCNFGSEMARKRRFQVIFHHFSPARPVAARFR